MMNKLNAKSLIALSDQIQTTACPCSIGACTARERFAEDRRPKVPMKTVSTLRDPNVDPSTSDKVLLRHSEFGDYYVDHHVRELDARLVV